jgi:hypothetical protein
MYKYLFEASNHGLHGYGVVRHLYGHRAGFIEAHAWTGSHLRM